MTTKEIWNLPTEERLAAFCERYLDLDEYTGNRTLAEKAEMAEIADAILPAMIRFVEQCRALTQKWRPRAVSMPEDMKAFADGQPNTVQMAATYGICTAQLQTLLDRLEGKQ